MQPDISVVIVGHAEGRLIHATVQSVEAAVQRAQHAGLAIEWLFLLDRPTDDLSRYMCERQPSGSSVVEVDFGDLGLSRNAAAQRAQGKYLSFIDGDDLWSSNWLVAAHEFASNAPQKCVMHYEWLIGFEKTPPYYHHTVDQESAEFCLDSLMEYTYWGASAFTLRETYLHHPFCQIDLENGFGYEDWHWACETVAAGYIHKVVPETIFGYRRKTWKSSLVTQSMDLMCLLPPSSLFALAYQR